jgi:hypothetical protein
MRVIHSKWISGTLAERLALDTSTLEVPTFFHQSGSLYYWDGSSWGEISSATGTNLAYVLTVADSGGDYTSIQAAVNALANSYEVIHIAPRPLPYSENVRIETSLNNLSILGLSEWPLLTSTPGGSNHALVFGGSIMLGTSGGTRAVENMHITGHGDGGDAVQVKMETGSVYLYDCVMSSVSGFYAINTASTGAYVHIERCLAFSDVLLGGTARLVNTTITGDLSCVAGTDIMIEGSRITGDLDVSSANSCTMDGASYVDGTITGTVTYKSAALDAHELASDPHTVYALLAGRSGGQVIYGGVDSGDDLTLESTSHATKGHVLLNPNGGPVSVGTSLGTYALNVNSGAEDVIAQFESTDSKAQIYIKDSGTSGSSLAIERQGDKLKFFSNGIETLRLDNGNLGINVGATGTDPSYILHAESAASQRFLLETTGVDTIPQFNLKNDAQEWAIRIDGSSADLIDIRNVTDGRSPFEILVSAPDGLMSLDADGVNLTDDIVMADGTGIGNSAGPKITFDDSGNYFEFSSGDIGVNTSSPDTALHVRDSSIVTKFERTVTSTNVDISTMQIQATSSNDMTDGFGPAIIFVVNDDTETGLNIIGRLAATRQGADNTGRLEFYSGADALNMVLDEDGKVGIGDTPSWGAFSVSADENHISLIETDVADYRWDIEVSGAHFVISESGTTEHFSISDVNGNVGIGVNPATQALHVQRINNAQMLFETTGPNTTPQVNLKNDAQEWAIRVYGSEADLLDIRNVTDGRSPFEILTSAPDGLMSLDANGVNLADDILMVDGASIGNSGGPTIEFDDTNDQFEFTDGYIGVREDNSILIELDRTDNANVSSTFAVGVSYNATQDYMYLKGGSNFALFVTDLGRVGVGASNPGSLMEWDFATENLGFVDAGSAGATAQDWIEVQVGGVTGYIRVYASK